MKTLRNVWAGAYNKWPGSGAGPPGEGDTVQKWSENILENTKIIFSEQARGDKTIEGFHVPSGVLVTWYGSRIF